MMKKIISLLAPVLLIIGMAGLTASCDRYEVERYYTGTADVSVDIDWMSRFGERPSGMTIMLAKDGDAITFTDITNDVDHYDLKLEPGEYKMIIMNRTFDEFGSMGFYQTKSFNDVFAYARQLQRTTEDWDVNANYKREPEAIGCAVDTFKVLPGMTDGEFRFVYWKDKIDGNYEKFKLREVVEPMATELYVRVKVIGFKYMAGVVGNISGMADGFLLSQAWRRSQQGYHFLDGWTIKAAPEESSEDKSVGYITTKIRTFGLPHGRELPTQRLPDYNMLSLCFTLIDDTKHVFRYSVGDKIYYREKDVTEFDKHDVALELELDLAAPFCSDDEVPHLPYAQPSGTGAFDAEVEDWGDEEGVDVPM